MSVVNTAIIDGERLAQELRPASITYAGDTIPCTIGNTYFFEQMTQAGFQSTNALHVKILRCDITPRMKAANGPFFSGQCVKIQNLDPESPGYMEIFDLIIGENNVESALVIQLNLINPIA